MITTVLILTKDSIGSNLRVFTIYVGDNPNVLSNPTCSGLSSISNGGWLTCGLQGIYIAISTNSFTISFTEFMMYSQERIPF